MDKKRERSALSSWPAMVELLNLSSAAQELVDEIGTWWNRSSRRWGARLRWKSVHGSSWLVAAAPRDAVAELISALHRRAPRDAVGHGAALQAR